MNRRSGNRSLWKTVKLIATLIFFSLMMHSGADCRVIELKVNELPDFSAQEAAGMAEAAVVRRFLSLHPNVRLKSGVGLRINGGGDTMDMVPLMQIAGDISPDLIYVNFRYSDTYIQKGFLKPLDEYIRDIPAEEMARRVPPAMRNVCYRLGPDGRKHWYCLPTTKSVRVLVYRRDMFAQAGLDPDKPPRTWSEFYNCARKLSNPDKNRYGMVFLKGTSSAYDFANLVWSRGGNIVVKNRSGNWQPSFNTREVEDALYFYLRMTRSRWTGPDKKSYRGVAYRDTNIDVNQTGDPYAMALSTLRERLNIHQPELIGFAPVPHPDGAVQSASEINSQMLGIYAGVNDPARARVAFEYMAFLDSDEANRLRTRIYIQRGFGKFVNPILLKRFGYRDYLKRVDKEWVKVYEDVMVHGKPEPYGKNCSVIYRELSRPIEQASNDAATMAALDRGDEQATRHRLRAILNQAQIETEARMFGTLRPAVKKLRLNVTLAFLAITALGFCAATFSLIKHFKRSAPPQMPGHKKAFFAYLLLLPAVATVILWQYYPLLRGTIMAFQDYSVMGKSPFVGVENFSTVLFDPSFWHAIYVTALYTALYMGFAFVTPILLALLLSEIPRGKILYRTLFFLPAVLSGLVVVFLWKSFYKPAGVINTLLSYVGVNLGVSWLDHPSLAMVAVLLPVIWAGAGPGSLIYLAALKTIPEEFYEAAEVDGAGVIRKITCITLPGLKMLILINAIGAFTGAFMSSEMIFAMTGGGPYTPYGATEVVGLQLFYTAFVYLKFGAANAMAWVLGFMLIGFTMFQLRNLSRVEFKGGR